ncbi:MAG: hypothetical protein H6648_00670 [Caldilineae bacterium]|nr:hypothetical protein [Caldilineae bacterium]
MPSPMRGDGAARPATWRRPCLALLPVGLCLFMGPSRPTLVEAARPAAALQQGPVETLPAFGLAHVDLMDLHASRRPDGGIERSERLPAADLSDRYGKAAAAGSGWNRWSLYWDMIETTPGAYDWQVSDGIVQRDRAAGLRTLAILQGTPGFHSTILAGQSAVRPAMTPVAGHGRSALLRGPDPFGLRSGLEAEPPLRPEAAPPSGLDRPIFIGAAGTTDDPALALRVNPDHPWARFVAASVTRYGPGGELARAMGWPSDSGVRTWEIGNEPNLAHFWSGSPAQFARYLEVAYLVIHWIDPGAIVLHGGIADDASAGTWYNAFLDALVARAGQSPLVRRHAWYFDAAAWHWYVYPNLLVTGPAQARRLLAGRGLPEKPIWVTEMGVPIWSEHPGPCWDPTSPWRASAPEQAGYVWQALAEGLASRVQVQILFQLYDDCGNGPSSYDAFGLVRNHASNQCWTPPEGQACWRLDPRLAGVPRPAYAALALASRELSGAELLWRPPRDANFSQRLLFYRPPDSRVQLVWNWLRAEQQVELFATGPEASIHALDADGALTSRQVAPVGGKHLLTLPGTTNRNNPGNQSPVMAGRPLILVERDAYAPFRAQVQGLPERSADPGLDLVVDAADGGTGIGAYQVFVSEGWSPGDPPDWQPVGEARDWPADRLSGTAGWRFEGRPGRRYAFAARASDRAGNWSTLPGEPQAWTLVDGPGPSPEPPSATPPTAPTPTSPSPTPPTATRVPPSPTPTALGPGPASATPSREAGSATVAPTPEAGRLWLPTLLRNQALGPATEPDCAPLVARVLGPKGVPVPAGPGARWWLQARLPDGGQVRIEAGLGEAICGAGALEIGAAAVGFGLWPDQPIARGLEIRLPYAPNAIVNADFEAADALTSWRLSGSAPARAAGPDAAFSGRAAAVLGAAFVGQPELGGGGNSTLSQVLRLPMGSPTFSGRYRIDGRLNCDATGCRRRDRLEVIVVDDERSDRPASYLTRERPLAEDTGSSWRSFDYDLSAWSGRRVEIILNLFQPDAVDPSQAWLDNLSIGVPSGTLPDGSAPADAAPSQRSAVR